MNSPSRLSEQTIWCKLLAGLKNKPLTSINIVLNLVSDKGKYCLFSVFYFDFFIVFFLLLCERNCIAVFVRLANGDLKGVGEGEGFSC